MFVGRSILIPTIVEGNTKRIGDRRIFSGQRNVTTADVRNIAKMTWIKNWINRAIFPVSH